MFGLTIEKLIVIGFLAAVIIGPQRLPLYAEKLATVVRNVRRFTESTRHRAEQELGFPVDAMDPTTWNRQMQRYDPRRIVRDALTTDSAVTNPDGGTDDEDSSASEESGETAPLPTQEVRERWVVVGGTSGHPVRRRIVEPVPASESDDPPAPSPETPEPDESTAHHGMTRTV
ncbi:preprotein translocase [Corynebacterium sp.]|uniref:preprotein translocase n=1 Tax=Corynebacterium sp. TaxID=1720 RepID=UPI0028A72A08|nr:preprotein translocase [Corynebacterium sp.]